MGCGASVGTAARVRPSEDHKPVELLEEGDSVTAAIFPETVKKGFEILRFVEAAYANYGGRTPVQEKARLDRIHDAVLEELVEKRKREGNWVPGFPRDLPPEESLHFLSRLRDGTVKLWDTDFTPANAATAGFNAGATRGFPARPGTCLAVVSAPGYDKALFSSALRTCAELGAGLAVVWEQDWGDSWWPLWRSNADRLHEEGCSLLVLCKGDEAAAPGQPTVGFAQTMEIMYLCERSYAFTVLTLRNFVRFSQGAPLHLAQQEDWPGLERALEALPQRSRARTLRTLAGGSVLHVAAGRGAPCSCLAALVLRGGWPLEDRDDALCTPLQIAACGAYEEPERARQGRCRDNGPQVSELLGLQAELEARTRAGETALHLCGDNGTAEAARSLVQARANLEAEQSSNGLRPLHLAAAYGHVSVAQVLLEARASLEAENPADYSNRPLHCAASWGHQSIIRLLLACRADTEAPNSQRSTPMDFARFKGHADVLRLLQKPSA